MDPCKYLLPNNLQGYVSHRECLLQQNHAGRHLAQFDNGNYLLWWPLDECFCNKVPCQCFITKGITKIEAKKLLQDN